MKVYDNTPPPVRCLKLWFHDGDVVLIAGYTVFRVHSGMLSRHSDIFAQFFASTPSKSHYHAGLDMAPEMIDGCPAVRVSDSAHNLKHVLRILYDGFDYLKPVRPILFADLAAAARLGHKYNLYAVSEEATRRLQVYFPSSFMSWEEHEDIRLVGPTLWPKDAIEAINLFRSIGWKEMLPTAFYLCCQLSPRSVLEGCRRADGILERLTLNDVELCWQLQKAFMKESAEMARQLYSEELSVAACRAKKKCEEALIGSRARFSSGRHFETLKGDPLGDYLRLDIDQLEKKKSICPVCARTLRESERGLRRAFWYTLPGLVGTSEEKD